jgi:hypothetical protein
MVRDEEPLLVNATELGVPAVVAAVAVFLAKPKKAPMESRLDPMAVEREVWLSMYSSSSHKSINSLQNTLSKFIPRADSELAVRPVAEDTLFQALESMESNEGFVSGILKSP